MWILNLRACQTVYPSWLTHQPTSSPKEPHTWRVRPGAMDACSPKSPNRLASTRTTPLEAHVNKGQARPLARPQGIHPRNGAWISRPALIDRPQTCPEEPEEGGEVGTEKPERAWRVVDCGRWGPGWCV